MPKTPYRIGLRASVASSRELADWLTKVGNGGPGGHQQVRSLARDDRGKDTGSARAGRAGPQPVGRAGGLPRRDPFGDHHVVAAVGVDATDRKQVLGLREDQVRMPEPDKAQTVLGRRRLAREPRRVHYPSTSYGTDSADGRRGMQDSVEDRDSQAYLNR